MSYTILITKQAKKDIDALEPTLRKRLGKKLLQVASLEDIHVVAKHLVNSAIGDHRIRMGDYRVLFDLEDRDMVILRVQHRKEVYR
jgi:mRNA interferase RelE/StbE